MRRVVTTPRDGWQRLVEAEGYRWHTEDGRACWREDACYVLSASETAVLRRMGHEVHALLLKAAEHVIEHGLWQRVGILPEHGRIIEGSWERGERSMIGRFDFLLDEQGQPKLLEYNADGALTMLETAIIQREWQKVVMPEATQFNELHERLVEVWRHSGMGRVHLAWRPRHPEVEGTMRYLARTVREAGLEAALMAMHCMGYDPHGRCFVDNHQRPIDHCCKLYPWAWMLEEPFARHLATARTRFIEPACAHLLGSKGLLSLLWELFPEHPAVLPCHDVPPSSGAFVSKPLFGREGQNVAVQGVDDAEATDGEFAGQPCVHQRFVRGDRHSGFLPQLGVWMVQGEAAGMGVREDTKLILHNDSMFVPHVI